VNKMCLDDLNWRVMK